MHCKVGNHEADWKAAGKWCGRHNRGHQGFVDGTSACLQCIEEESERSETTGGAFLQEILSVLSRDEREELLNWLGLVEELTRTSRARCFTRALATKALRTKTSLDAVMQEVSKTRSVAKIIPWPFGEWEREGIPPLQ